MVNCWAFNMIKKMTKTTHYHIGQEWKLKNNLSINSKIKLYSYFVQENRTLNKERDYTFGQTSDLLLAMIKLMILQVNIILRIINMIFKI